MKRISLNKVMAKLAEEQDSLQLKEWQKEILEVELGEEVHLSSVKELKNFISQTKANNASLSKISKKINTAIKKYNSAVNELNSISKQGQYAVTDLMSEQDKIRRVLKQFEQSASEFGVSPNDVPEYKELRDLNNDQTVIQQSRAIDELRRIVVSNKDINPLP